MYNKFATANKENVMQVNHVFSSQNENLLMYMVNRKYVATEHNHYSPPMFSKTNSDSYSNTE